MKRRKFLIGLGSAGIGGSALIGSSAFSRVEADRSMTIQTAEDPNAYLGMDKCGGDNPTPNGSYAHLDELGHLKIFMDDENPTIPSSDLGNGINSDSTSVFDRVFQICNQGKEDACVWIQDDDAWPTVPSGDDIPDDAEGEPRVEFYLEDDDSRSIVGEDNAVGVELGECRCIGIKVRSYGLSEGDTVLDALDDEITIAADVGANCNNPPPGEITEDGRLSLAYEDLPEDDSDWDYNDWIIDIFGTFLRCGEGGTGGVKQFNWDIVPQARGAGDTHRFEFDFDCSGEYDLTRYDQDGHVIDTSTDSFTGGTGTVDITIWDDTSDVLPDLSNTDGSCTTPGEWAELEVRFDDCCSLGMFNGGFNTHGGDLPFNPVLENKDKSLTVEKGDHRLLVVPGEFDWPTEQEHIADAYAGVSKDSDGDPVFDSDWETSNVTGNVTSCNFEVQSDDSLNEVS